MHNATGVPDANQPTTMFIVKGDSRDLPCVFIDHAPDMSTCQFIPSFVRCHNHRSILVRLGGRASGL